MSPQAPDDQPIESSLTAALVDERSSTDDSVEVEWVARRANHVSKTIKGILLALAAALGLELASDAGAAALALAGTVVAVVFGNVYGDAMQDEIRSARRMDIRRLGPVIRHSAAIVLGAAPAFVLFTLAWLEVIATETAIDVALWSGIGLLFVLGYFSGRVIGDEKSAALKHGFLLAVIGVGVLALKSLH